MFFLCAEFVPKFARLNNVSVEIGLPKKRERVPPLNPPVMRCVTTHAAAVFASHHTVYYCVVGY